jgi:transcriptional regulator GlxA family with amidase domain
VVLAFDGISPFELGVASEVFGVDRSCLVQPWPRFTVCAPHQGSMRTAAGFRIEVPGGLDRLDGADLIIIPWWGELATPPPPPAIEALRRAIDRGASVMSFSSGAFVLGHAGLLDRRRATTHWVIAAELARMFPRAIVDPDVLFVADRLVMTSAGAAAAIDLSLHVVRETYGPRIAAAIARRMVAPPLRCGGQSQYVDTPVGAAHTDRMAGVLRWMASHLDHEMTIEDLARQARMSVRTFARRFQSDTGTTPHRWLTSQRIQHSERLLAETDLPIDLVAHRAGFGTSDNFRHQFRLRRGVSPQRYRQSYRLPSRVRTVARDGATPPV